MIIELAQNEYPRIWPLVRELAEYNLFIMSVIEGYTPGSIFIDDEINPKTVFLNTPEGSFLVGDTGNTKFNSSIRELIPDLIDLSVYPNTWEPKIREIIGNNKFRRYRYRYYTLGEQRIGDWRSRIPCECEFLKITSDFLDRGWENLDQVTNNIEKKWVSVEEFLKRSFCFIIANRTSILSLCFSDCVIGERCELGVWTAAEKRSKGLATLVVAGTVECVRAHCCR